MTTFTRIDHPGVLAAGVLLRLPEVLLPIRWWRGISLLRAVPSQMSSLERFTLELATTCGRAEPDEFFEITGLPGTLLPVAARRLVNSGTLRVAGDMYTPNSPAAETALQRRELLEHKPAKFDIVVLPHTGDVLALDPRSSWLRAADQLRIRSAANRPVPAHLSGSTLSELLTRRLSSGDLAGAGPDILGVADSQLPSPQISPNGWCPVYRCEANLVLDAERHVPQVTFTGAAGKDPVVAHLPGADALAARWRQVTDILATPSVRAKAWNVLTGHYQHVAPRAEQLDVGRWRFYLSGEHAQQIAERPHNLTVPLCLGIGEDDLTAEVTIELDANDPAAAELMELDRKLSAASQPGAQAAMLPDHRRARKRAWQLGFHALVYAMRESKDFYYD